MFIPRFPSDTATATPSFPPTPMSHRLKFAEGLDSLAGTGKDTEDVESDLKSENVSQVKFRQ